MHYIAFYMPGNQPNIVPDKTQTNPKNYCTDSKLDCLSYSHMFTGNTAYFL